jgi:hypothetical protein
MSHVKTDSFELTESTLGGIKPTAWYIAARLSVV